MRLPMKDNLVAHYIRAYGLCAVLVIDRDGAIEAIATAKPYERWRRLRASARLIGWWWFASEDDAQAIVAHRTDKLPDEAADKLGIAVATDTEIRARAVAAIDAAKAKLAAMNAIGGLKSLNIAYRDRRRRRARRGRKTETYAVFQRRYLMRLLDQMAAARQDDRRP